MTDDLSDIISVFPGGMVVAIKAKPGIARSRDLCIVDIGEEKRALEVTVGAAAQDGKANRAILERLAEEFDLKKSDLSIKSGLKSRLKLVEIRGDTNALCKRHAYLLMS